MLISVVMAVYNGDHYLQEAIESILNQTYQDFEFIIVNDGSFDNTAEILKDVQDSRVRIIHIPENKGAANALNIGIRKATGKWIAIQDADDISIPTRLEEQAVYIQEHPHLAALGTLKKCFSGNKEIPSKRLRSEEFGNFLISSEHMKAYRFYINPLCHGSVLFSKKIFEEVGGYDTSYRICYDYDLWMRMFEVGEIHKINKKLYQYRIHADSISNKKQLYNEDWVVASNYIKKSVKNERNSGRDPQIIVLGNSQACNEFKEVSMVSNMKVHSYIKTTGSDNSEKIYRLFHENKIDGVVVLEGLQFNTTFQALEDKGMELNKNLFKIWAGYWG
ncbi:glycosyltransferase [Bacillus sp. Marseille-Q3570]|uniref:glycosyltransferase n=1 Tax=Bacillus sp. Marseille-Q3570 TaxID=2963522 RepID=UPI0021B72792|nr:glycosyltransferase [Bacillus sp. Marseille-Q3570]